MQKSLCENPILQALFQIREGSDLQHWSQLNLLTMCELCAGGRDDRLPVQGGGRVVEGSAQRSCWRLPIQLRRGNSSPPHIVYAYLSTYISI